MPTKTSVSDFLKKHRNFSTSFHECQGFCRNTWATFLGIFLKTFSEVVLFTKNNKISSKHSYKPS